MLLSSGQNSINFENLSSLNQSIPTTDEIIMNNFQAQPLNINFDLSLISPSMPKNQPNSDFFLFNINSEIGTTENFTSNPQMNFISPLPPQGATNIIFVDESKDNDYNLKRQKNAYSSKISRDKKRRQEVIDYNILQNLCQQKKKIKDEIKQLEKSINSYKIQFEYLNESLPDEIKININTFRENFDPSVPFNTGALPES